MNSDIALEMSAATTNWIVTAVFTLILVIIIKSLPLRRRRNRHE